MYQHADPRLTHPIPKPYPIPILLTSESLHT